MSTDRYTEVELTTNFPQIAWREPIQVTFGDERPAWCCRICIAQGGLTRHDPDRLFATEEAARAHIEAAHPAEEVGGNDGE